VKLAIFATMRGGQSQLKKVFQPRRRRVIMLTSRVRMRQVINANSSITISNKDGDTVTVYQNPQIPSAPPAWPAGVPPQNTNFLYPSETLGNEFSVLRCVILIPLGHRCAKIMDEQRFFGHARRRHIFYTPCDGYAVLDVVCFFYQCKSSCSPADNEHFSINEPRAIHIC